MGFTQLTLALMLPLYLSLISGTLSCTSDRVDNIPSIGFERLIQLGSKSQSNNRFLQYQLTVSALPHHSSKPCYSHFSAHNSCCPHQRSNRFIHQHDSFAHCTLNWPLNLNVYKRFSFHVKLYTVKDRSVTAFRVRKYCRWHQQ